MNFLEEPTASGSAAADGEPARIESALLWLERQRGDLDDDLLDLALSPLRERLQALQAGAPPTQQLRQVTVMFADVVGSTALGHALEPEDINLVMDGALARFTAIIERWQGRVLQYTGDGLLAAFGTTVAHEDDAERAVMAGLGIVSETAVHADRVRRQHRRAGFGVRVGLHTGPVLLGGGVDGDNTIRGSTVNLAARMEQNTAPGTLRVSADTWRQCAAGFLGLEQPPLTVKGRTEPMRTWIIERARPRHDRSAARGVAGRRAPLIGRKAELALLQQAWQRLHLHDVSASSVNVVTLMGDAGLGKSRLEAAFDEWVHAQDQPALWLRTACQPQTQRQPYAMLRGLLADALQLPDGDTAAQARERFVAAVVPMFERDEGEAQAHVLGQLLGLNFADSPHVRGLLGLGAQMRTLAYHAAAEVLLRLAARRNWPLVLRLEDLHWADASSLHFMRHLLALPATRPLLVLALARPTLDEHDGAWRAVETRRIHLHPLDASACSALADALLAPLPQPPPALHSLLLERAAGNPFYMEELVQMLLDRGALQATDASTAQTPQWRFEASRFDASGVPTTLTGVLQARMDELSPAARVALQKASVLGVLFARADLAALDAIAPLQLQALQQRGLVAPQARGALDSQDDLAFAHQLLHQVVYGSLLRRDRHDAHARAARWFAAQEGARSADWLVTTADHFERADLALDAAHYSLLAAEELALRFAHEAVADQAARGLRLAAEDDHERRWRLLLLRQRALRHSGQAQAQGEMLIALEQLAQKTGDPLRQATAAMRRLVALQESGQTQQALAAAPHAVLLARAVGNADLEGACCNAWAGALRVSGQHAQAETVGGEALLRVRAAGLSGLESELLNGLSAVAIERGDLAAAEHFARAAVTIERERHNRVGECAALINLGANALQRGDLVQAESDLDEAMALSRSTGRKSFEISVHLNRSALAFALQQFDVAEQAALAARSLALTIANLEAASFANMSLGTALLALNAPAEAEVCFQSAHQGLQALKLPHLAIEAVGGLARSAQMLQSTAQALEWAELIHAHWLTWGHFNGTERPWDLCLACCEVLGELDHRGLALAHYAWQSIRSQAARLAPASRAALWQAHGAHRKLLTMGKERAWQ